MPRPIQPPIACPDCGGSLVTGRIVDNNRYGALAAQWVPGEVARSTWTGNVKNEGRLTVLAFRCSVCGVLRLYAPDEPGDHS